MVTALVGSTGFIGKTLLQSVDVDIQFNSSNIDQAKNQKFDTLYCCAPSGNRLLANQNAEADLANIKNLISILESADIGRLILISTVDTQHAPESPYGRNRLLLENFAKTLDNHHIVRLCALIDSTIRKNVLFDLKHQKFLDSINLDQIMQWYRLGDLPQHLNTIVANNIDVVDLVSEPISMQETIDKFFKNLDITTHRQSKPYDLTCDSPLLCVNDTRYVYTKSQIFEFIKSYLND